MENENKKSIGWIVAMLLGGFAWFLQGTIAAGTALKKSR